MVAMNNDTRPERRRPLFPLGRCCVTPGAVDALSDAATDAATLLHRHEIGDWGRLCEEDKRANDAAVRAGERVISSYVLTSAVEVWVITEADRSVTTVILPEEY